MASTDAKKVTRTSIINTIELGKNLNRSNNFSKNKTKNLGDITIINTQKSLKLPFLFAVFRPCLN